MEPENNMGEDVDVLVYCDASNLSRNEWEKPCQQLQSSIFRQGIENFEQGRCGDFLSVLLY